jgi:hypothetical protein
MLGGLAMGSCEWAEEHSDEHFRVGDVKHGNQSQEGYIDDYYLLYDLTRVMGS